MSLATSTVWIWILVLAILFGSSVDSILFGQARSTQILYQIWRWCCFVYLQFNTAAETKDRKSFYKKLGQMGKCCFQVFNAFLGDWQRVQLTECIKRFVHGWAQLSLRSWTFGSLLVVLQWWFSFNTLTKMTGPPREELIPTKTEQLMDVDWQSLISMQASSGACMRISTVYRDTLKPRTLL